MLEPVQGPLLGGTMYLQVYVLGLEARQFLTEVSEVPPAVARDEVVFQVPEGILHLPLPAGFPYPAGNRLDVVMTAQLQEMGVPPEMVGPGVDDEAGVSATDTRSLSTRSCLAAPSKCQ